MRRGGWNVMYKLKESSRRAAVDKFEKYVKDRCEIEDNVIETERNIQATAIVKVLCAKELLSGGILHINIASQLQQTIDPEARNSLGLTPDAVQNGIVKFISSWMRKGFIEKIEEKKKITA